MIVASRITATASQRPSALMSSVDSVEDGKHGDHHERCARHGARRRSDAALDRFLGRDAPVDEFLDPAEDEHVVVHREPEEHGEQEERQPVTIAPFEWKPRTPSR